MFRTLPVLLTLLVLAGCGKEETTEQYIQQAKDAMAASEYRTATIELKNALRQDPNSAQARWLLGKVSLESGDVLSASKELKQALDLGWPPDDIQPAMAQALFAQEEFEAVGELAAEGMTPNAQASLFGLQAQAALALGNEEAAEALIDKALALKPEDVEVLIAKARLLDNRDDSKGALALVQQIIAIEPERGDAWSLKAEILSKEEDYKGSLVAYNKAVKLKRDNAADLFKRALLKMHLGDYESAQRDARALMSKKSKHPGSNYVQGLLHYEAGNYDEAIASLSVTEPAFKQYPLSMFFLANANLIQGNMDLATNQAVRFHNLSPGSVQGRKLLAVIRLEQNDFASVQQLLQPVLDSNPDDVDALNLTSDALLKQGKTSEAIELLARVAELQPDSAEAKVRLGAGMLMGGEGDEAVQPIQTALEMNPNLPMADILLVLNHVQKEDYPAAIKAAKAYQRNNPDSAAPLNLLGRVYQDAGKPEQARKAFQDALKADSTDPSANFYLAQMALADNDNAGARNYFEAILRVQPDSPQAHLQLAMLDAQAGKGEAMAEHLEKAMLAAPTALEPRLLLARYYLDQAKPEQVAPLFTDLTPQQQNTSEALLLTALAQLAMKEANAAQFSLEKLLESSEDSAKIRHLMAMAAADQGDAARTEEQLRLSLELDEGYLPSRIALAKMLLAAKDMDAFNPQIDKLEVLAPNNPDVLLMQASAAQHRGELPAAKKLAEKAFKAAPSSDSLITLAAYEEAVGERARALARLAAWLEKNPDDIAVRLAYGSSLMLDGQVPQSTTQYAIILQAAPDNLTALNNQAWILKNKEPAQALEYARRAASLAPDSSAILDTLALVEYSNEEYVQAQRSILKALKAAPDDPSIRYHSAMIAVANNDKSTARSTLKKLIAANKPFPELADAKALLAKLDN
ncbi:Beta-barrel assembly-enhancing protease [Halioglobus japonicus]|nr:Beta-barrel assembly-enhancing protease [Halioglobus japonicus]